MARTEPQRVAIAACIGAALGACFALDQVIIGTDQVREISDVVPALGFFWLVPGTAALAVAVLFTARACQGASRILHSLGADSRHAHHCMHRRRRFQRSHRCTCRLNPATWSPEDRRQALRVLEGGRR